MYVSLLAQAYLAWSFTTGLTYFVFASPSSQLTYIQLGGGASLANGILANPLQYALAAWLIELLIELS